MIDFFKNILPRVLTYSKDLDEKEIFVEKPWIFIDENNNHHEYIFMRDGRLVMSLNGAVTIGSWELMPNKKLMINRLVDTIMLQKMFVNDALLLLQKSGTIETPFTLINERVIPDLDAISYLKSLEGEKEETLPIEASKYKVFIRKDGIAEVKYQVMNFDKVGNIDGEVVSGTFRTNKKNVQEYIEVKNGEVFNIYYVFKYTYNGKEISIKQKNIFGIQRGDMVENYKIANLPVGESIKIKDINDNFVSLRIDNIGYVTSTYDGSDSILIVISLILLIVLLFAILVA